ncbi:response regulator transcription factor [Cryobacterium lactosi]|uniref:Response regulator transcription factor n=1 Tax=Cryobacterium lactosi TaxID=1259202 RepID=A0A4R9BI79_9MICO|nr:LytTR family DNA-binding domain-containing protein [Cryobacterium lactosi]TFD83525.1 response regulator transcription factor [Cryobacterium lactosi]
MLNVAIVDDDASAVELLRASLSTYSARTGENFEITAFPEATRFLDGYRARFDIVFMDIEMPTMDGMTAAAHLRAVDAQVALIFVTNIVQLAAKGYEVDALDYIIKPFAYPDFERKLRRAVRACQHFTGALVVAQQGGTRRVLLRDIQFIEVRGHSLLLHTEDGIIHGSGTLQDTERKLSGEGFLRCSKAYLVNQKHVTVVKGMILTMSSGERLSIGRSYRKTFMSELAEFLGEAYVI